MNELGRMRVYRGIKQKELAKGIGCSLGTIQRYENILDVKEMKYKTLMLICNALGITTERILTNGL